MDLIAVHNAIFAELDDLHIGQENDCGYACVTTSR
jgi:hypothetical protein